MMYCIVHAAYYAPASYALVSICNVMQLLCRHLVTKEIFNRNYYANDASLHICNKNNLPSTKLTLNLMSKI